MFREAFKHKHGDIAISLTIYNQSRDTTRRDFHLRNITGESEAEKVERAQQIMNEVATEIHYLTGYGIDKGVVKMNKRKAAEVVYPNLETPPGNWTFLEGVLFRFHNARYYVWDNDKGTKGFRIREDRLDEGWRLDTQPTRTVVSFRLPCLFMPELQRRNYEPDQLRFFGMYPPSGRRRKRKNTFGLGYDRNDITFQCFISRFYPEGNLSFGERYYYAAEDSQPEIVGTKWPKSKAKPKKYPRKTVLASQPNDNTDFVYIIRMGRTQMYKIGKSNDPQGRLASLQTASPYKLKLLHTFAADNATAAEESLHAALHNQRMEGEWFKLSDEQQKALIVVNEYKEGNFVVGEKGITAKTFADNLIM